jgi:hypothetical protein
METWEVWDDLPATITDKGITYRLLLTKGDGANCVQYKSEEHILKSSYNVSLHQALDKMWLWWQDYEVKK